jgi:hypothetical protein
MIALSLVNNPVLVTHHFIQTAEQLHIESCTDNTNRQKHNDMTDFHWHTSFLFILACGIVVSSNKK